jgi:hypothetical protein
MNGWRRRAAKLSWISIGTALLITGCSKSAPPKSEPAPTTPATSVRKPADTTSVAAAIPVVRQFLDAMRRGGADSQAQALLTSAAQKATAASGLVLQPIGAPDAKYEVTRAEPYPGESNACLVHSRWEEPGEQGAMATYEVVWMLQNEQQQWRISGMVLEADPNSDPISVDFEDPADVLAKLSGQNSTTPTPPANGGDAADGAVMQTAATPGLRQ